jgi:large subunit ribosomal protein L16
MFVTSKQKKFPFYFKPSNVFDLEERNSDKYRILKNFYHIKCLRSGYITLDPLKAIIRLFKYFIKNFDLEKDLKYKLFVFPDFVLTSKPKEVRMGKGKGANLSKVAIIKKGQIVFSLSCTPICSNLIPIIVRKLAHKIPLRAVVAKNS